MIRIFPSELKGIVDDRTYKRLLEIYNLIYDLSDQVSGSTVTTLTPAQLQQIKTALQARGPAQLNVQGLLGVLAQAQVAGAPAFATFPVPADPRSQDGALGVLAGTPNILYRYDQVSRTWVIVGAKGLLIIDHNAVAVGTRPELNFDDSDVVWTIADDSVNNRINLQGAVQAYKTVQDEGVDLTQRTKINFTGAGVTASDVGGVTKVDIPGASSGITELTGDVTAGPGSGSQAATIPNDTVTYAKMQNVAAASRLLGRGSASGSGDVEEISLGTNLSMSGTTLNANSGGIVASQIGLIQMVRQTNYQM